MNTRARGRERRSVVVALSMMVVLAMGIGPVWAATFGQPDNGEHPHVGLIYFQLDEGIFRCSGTLIDPKVVLTAAHCTAGAEGPALRTWVTFDERVEIPDEVLALPDEEFGEWLDANPRFISGTGIPHPDFDDFASWPDIHDIGVVVLDRVVTGLPLATLPSPNLLEGLRGQDKSGFTVVGYGLQGYINPFFGAERARYKGDVRLVEIKSASTVKGQATAKFTNNPGNGNGSGGSCFGDSGGPVFRDGAVVAVVSWGITPCIGVDYQYRVDTPDSLAWLRGILEQYGAA